LHFGPEKNVCPPAIATRREKFELPLDKKIAIPLDMPLEGKHFSSLGTVTSKEKCLFP
jgi:hypothetical protein